MTGHRETFDLVVRGGRLGDAVVDIGIADGVIAEISPELPAGVAEVSATGRDVLPGAVDAHVHLNDPGRAHWEGFATGTRALAAGGTTCAADMPLNAHPPTLDGPSFDAKVEAATGRLQVDVALWGGLVPGNVDHFAELAERGVVGFKAFMCPSGIDDFPYADEDTLGEGMRRAAALRLPVAVHAESPALVTRLTEAARAAGTTGWWDYLASRPVAAELEAIDVAIAIAAETGCALHIVHVSCGSGIARVVAARARGIDVTCETCPHYLLLEEDDLEVLGASAKCAPPLRPADERASLVAALRAGDVDTVGSDHSPSPPELKTGDDAFAIWGGIAGAQTLLASLLGLELGEALLSRVVASAPADRLGLLGKGRLAPGADADLALVARGPWTPSRDDLQDRHRQSPFVGRAFAGRVVTTILRGRVVWDGERFGPPTGRLLRRE